MFEQTIWLEDVGIMKDKGFDAYKSSISCPGFYPARKNQLNFIYSSDPQFNCFQVMVKYNFYINIHITTNLIDELLSNTLIYSLLHT